jgi:hypothetical protein
MSNRSRPVRVQLLFPGGEQVGQDGGQAGGLQFAGHVAIAWAVPAAAAAVREQHDSTLRLGNRQVGVQRHTACGNLKALLNQVHNLASANVTLGVAIRHTANG